MPHEMRVLPEHVLNDVVTIVIAVRTREYYYAEFHNQDTAYRIEILTKESGALQPCRYSSSYR